MPGHTKPNKKSRATTIYGRGSEVNGRPVVETGILEVIQHNNETNTIKSNASQKPIKDSEKNEESKNYGIRTESVNSESIKEIRTPEVPKTINMGNESPRISKKLGLVLPYFKDNTKQACMLLSRGGHIVFMRPRKFGKSTFLRLVELLAGGFKNKELFIGTWAYKHSGGGQYKNPTIKPSISESIKGRVEKYDWEERAVVHLDFSKCGRVVDSLHGFLQSLFCILKVIGIQYNIQDNIKMVMEIDNILDIETRVNIYFQLLIQELAKKFGRGIVFLLDEYDWSVTRCTVSENNKAITEAGLLKECINWLKSFLSIAKSFSTDSNTIHLSIITGVTNISLHDIYSGANHLKDLTLDFELATAFGHTMDELKYFITDDKVEEFWKKCYLNFEYELELSKGTEITEESLKLLTKSEKQNILLDIIKRYYNGYMFCPDSVTVCNPYSLTCCLDVVDFRIKLEPIYKHHILDDAISNNIEVAYQLLEGNFLFENIPIGYLLFSQESKFIRRNENTEGDSRKFFTDYIFAMASILFQSGIITIKDTRRQLMDLTTNGLVSSDQKQHYMDKISEYDKLDLLTIATLDCPNKETNQLIKNDDEIKFIIKNHLEKKKLTHFGLWKLIDDGKWKEFFEILYSKIMTKMTYLQDFKKELREASYQLRLISGFHSDGFIKDDENRGIRYEVLSNTGRLDIILETTKNILIIELKGDNIHPQRAFDQCVKYASGNAKKDKQLVICGLSFNTKTKTKKNYRNIRGFYLKVLEMGSESINSCVSTVSGEFEDNKLNNNLTELPEGYINRS